MPQGSVLRSRLFNVFINDDPSRIRSKLTLYTNDLKLLGPCSSFEDHTLLQNNLDLLGQLAEAWLLKYYVTICHVLHLTQKKKNPCHSYFLSDHPIPSVNDERGLGINIDN